MPNALASETSPYLLQHAENPVAWLPWGEAAFAKARAEEKPIFLSIGYSTCHWCHVMARESFEDADTAAILNEHFVSIKVDREERPDVDKVYMTYVQALTGQGGWPLSAWLTADLKPFYGGTYFPPVDHPGRVGFPSLLRAIAHAWATERPKLIAEADRVIHTLKAQAEAATSVSAPDDGFDIVDAAGQAFEQGYESLRQSFDEANGGFGGAPKFPRASNLNFLLRCAVLQGLESETGREAVRMTATTMEKMAAGGIHDHVGGGFHRYAVDGAWFVPHFEKMLGDQAQIAMNALDAHLYTGREEHAWLARAVFDYVLRDLTSPQGGFFSAEDADSADPSTGRAHAEGAFYVWTRAEVEAVLGADALLVCDHFGIRAEGNVPAELDPHGDLRGRNILQQRQSIAVTAKSHGLSPEAASDRLVAALDTLRSARERRPRPLRDEKIITAWNGLMISALVRGAGSPAACLADQRTRYETAAVAAARFIERELYDNERGILYRHHRNGRGASEGFAEDYAFLISGLLDLYEVSFEPEWLLWTRRLQATMDARFRDEANGGYFNSAADDPSIVLRLKEDHDGAEPSPNSIATANLLRLAGCFHDDGFREKARSTLRALRDRWITLPHALPEMLCSLERMLEVPRQVVFAGDRHSPQFAELVAVARERPGPRRALLAADPVIAAELPWLQPLVSRDSQAVAYVCENHACQLPARTPAELRARLGE